MELTKEQFLHDFKDILHEEQLIKVEDATSAELFQTLARTIRKYITPMWLERRNKLVEDKQKIAYYFSIEFLPGRMLETNLLNLGILDVVKEGFDELGIDFTAVKQAEYDMALGNGGLGRLAAAFMDSLATTGYPGFGNGIRYRYGLFKQKIVDGYQVELPDDWFGSLGNVWETRKDHDVVDVKIFGNVYLQANKEGRMLPIYENSQTLRAVPYDVPQIGFGNDVVNNLRLWDVEIPEEYELDYPTIEARRKVQDITAILYPDDSSYEGKELRLIQEYFMTSAGLQTIIKSYRKQGLPLEQIHEKVSVHINDTHPAVAPAEFMRLLLDDCGLEWADAWNATVQTMSYTNHTILSEALERWDAELFKNVLPRVYQIILEIDNRYIADMAARGIDPQVIEHTRIVKDNQIHMAHLAIIGGHSVNGVAKLHTELLKEDTLRDFYAIYPEKFNNKTNGIIQRRWLQIADEPLSNEIDRLIGKGWRTDIHELRRLLDYKDDQHVLSEFYNVKQEAKARLATFIKESTGVEVSTEAIFDVQVKRLHAYKRQLLNLLHILKLYWDLKDNPDKDMVPRVFIFGAKAAPGYHFAKSVIKLINEVANLVNNDESLQGKLKVVFLENYRVSLAELIIPAADVSEQISLASKEASGTSNMKFMMTGAITLATLDGANIEIKDEVGDDNIVIFGMDKDEVYDHYARHDYDSRGVYENNPIIRRVVDSFVDGTLPNVRNEGSEIYEALITHNDEYFLLEDFASYVAAQEKIDQLYRDKEKWACMSLVNIATSDKFTSDDTIEQYAKEIWNLKKD
ncbi:glycogen/starch/alpha-glucan phosphorylase [Streptococcus constellatus subsp. pharyngis]|uniref:Alpha-1,4 glucan phosphorylase n=1 Tax=Streptococcus constellatus subsp. pharyngis SK1060 = CCUG 46377 TaxID=1035184 RepID=F9P5A2_STRCV|nr:glycogen/starch/alpha-glucan phosphorylase [Streptococcus constellatus]AGU72492.1 putative glycogen/starch phosphorylase [Streptococcus constellatus subsp. pharyngis C232]AGU74248.1 putative glycogen/starch phosphorylase [Streptococcus constellatus subsp. pharyngis C818]AGU79616.1 putative glycogen/starch phosphorylase [Streptococcus constellatus subsp. pharyngis C1050]EGV10409.1 phosphorylase, glycogen/starch/alpha-glucan family [Streptococcus constellatus subsp. pharyngis SK1060 = CCUG 463